MTFTGVNRIGVLAFIPMVLAALAGCAEGDAPRAGGQGDAAVSSSIAAGGEMQGESAGADEVLNDEGGLAGTSWRLVRIQYMNDTEDLPGSSEGYTLEFLDGENVAIGADCNRGRGTWTSEGGSQLRFGPIASTRALCPPPSISEKYLAQFEWVRSYVRRDGHLYLATMADGSIIEFEPLPPVVATVLGREVRAADDAELIAAVLTPVLKDYADNAGIAVDEAEVAALVEKMAEEMRAMGLNAMDELSEAEREQAMAMRRAMAREMIFRWKVNRALYEQYGGRVSAQQLGPEPLDAYRELLQATMRTGNLAFTDDAMAEKFWAYFSDGTRHDLAAADSERATQAFAKPPWEKSGN